MFHNQQVEENLSNQTNSLDMDSINKTYPIKTLNINEQNREKNSYTGTSMSSANRIKENESYNNFISKIKLNYNLMHPRQRIQTIILHLNLDKSINMSDTSMNDLKYNDLSGNMNNNLNTGFILDNPGQFTTNENKNNKRRTLDNLNKKYEERFQKGEEEEKNNQSAEAKKNKLNIHFNNNLFDKNYNENSRINLGSIFNHFNDEPENDKVYLCKNGFIDNQQWTKKENKEELNKKEKIPSSSYMLQNNPFLGISQNELLGKEGKSVDMDHISNNMNNFSTNMNTNSTNDDIFQYGKRKFNEKEISSFNGINNASKNSFPFSRRSYSHLGSQLSESINKSENDNIGTKFTFRGNDENDNKFLHRNSLPQNYQQNKMFNNYYNNDQKAHFQNDEENIANKSRNNNLYRKPEEINHSEQFNSIKNNNNIEEEYIKYAKFDNNNREINPNEKGNNIYTQRNNYINKKGETDNNLSLTINDLDKNEIEDKKYRKKGKNCLKSFLYGLLFGSTATGIYWIQNEETRKYFLEKLKKINFNSIINFFKIFFSNPVAFFKKLFNNERMKDYIKVFGITLGNFFDIFERYEDWLRFIGIILSVYLIWIIFKSLFKVFFKVWKNYN